MASDLHRGFQWMGVDSHLLVQKKNGEDDVFSYPYGGRKDYSKESVRICREIGFKKVASNFAGQMHSWTNRYEIPRCLVRNWGWRRFSKEVSEFFASI